MRRIPALATALILAALPAVAGEGAPRIHGTLTSWDGASHVFRISKPDGSDSVFHWNERTRMRGTPKVGERVLLEYQRDATGNAMATRIAKDASRREPSPSLTKS